VSAKGQRPKVIVIAGPNGAGKSTLAPLLLRDSFGLLEYVNADTIAQGLSAFQPETAAFEAGRIMLKRLHHLAAQRVPFAFESTLAGRVYAAWFERLRRDGYDVAEEGIRRRYAQGLYNAEGWQRFLEQTR
jgi:predicted ABC-type ATPase